MPPTSSQPVDAVSERSSVFAQYPVLQRLATAYAGFVAGHRWGPITTRLIRRFIRKFGVNMAEAVNPDPLSYKTFNEFFTRALKPEARPLSNAAYLCPVDGEISQFGAIQQDQIFQAKGHQYSTTALVGGDAALGAQFDNGSFATLYLSPRDYHRIHMPCDGVLQRMIYVPGTLYSVNPATARSVPGLFARNERVVCLFETAQGPFILVLVGATIVGSMATVWHGVVNPPRTRDVREWTYADNKVSLQKGTEMGRFLLGSTVVMLWPRGRAAFNPDWAPERAIRLGEKMADLAAQ
jgi:phosphatidylserine decarboxylase